MKVSVGADTNILFSAIFYGGAGAPLVQAIKFKKIEFYQSEYIRDELVAIAKRKGMPLKALQLFYDLDNVHIVKDSSYFSKQEFSDAKKIVRDEKDVPVFVFAKKLLELKKIDCFVSGDQDLLEEKVKKALFEKMLSLREFNEFMLQEF